MNERIKPNSAWQPVAAAACFLCAVFSLAIGFLLTTGWLLDAHRHPFLHGIGVFLLIVGLPILFLGGHFMDLRDRKVEQSRSHTQDDTHVHLLVGLVAFLSLTCVSSVGANAQQTTTAQQTTPSSNIAVSREPKSEGQDTQPSNPKWQYGGFVDLAYPLNFNHPVNRLFRSRGTAFRTDAAWLNMAGFYVRKKPSEESRWGVEATVHAGKDAEVFGFSATAPNIAGYKFLRQLGPTNVSYLAPAGKGLTLQAGIFTSFIGYDSLYAKDNLNYTRPWGADFTPYLMWGANASYPFTDKLTGTFFVVNGYWHLARANSAPSVGSQIAYKINPQWTVKQAVLIGPHQRNTASKYWRFLSDTIVERRAKKTIVAFDTNFSTERVAEPFGPRAWWLASQLPVRWIINDRWSVSVRPEVAWDSEGRWTLSKQTVKAFTSTLEYRVPHKWTTTILRMEHRWDDSRGPQGGFFRGREVSPGVVRLTPSQHLLNFAAIFTFDSDTGQL